MLQDRRRPLREHLEELRRRLLISLLALVIGVGVSAIFYKRTIQWLLLPAQGLASVPTGKPIFTEVTELLGVAMKVSLLGGFLLAFPVILYQLLMFAAPGLTQRERTYLFVFLPLGLLCLAGGMAFSYFVLLPPALRFLLTFGADLATPMIRIGNYMSLILTLMFWTGVAFETPLVMYLLARLGVVNPDIFARGRRYAVVGAFLLGAVITPTFDPLNQALVAAPLIVLYELGIWLSKLARLQRAPQRRRTRVPAKAQDTH